MKSVSFFFFSFFSFFFFLILSLNISGGVRISIPGTAGKDDADYHDYDNDERFLLDVCGQLTNETLLIEGKGVNLRADGFRDYQYGPKVNNSTVVGYYKAEQRNITDITGTCKTYTVLANLY